MRINRPIRLPRFFCQRCSYEWTPRVSCPYACPGCGSVLWNLPRVRPVTPRQPRAEQRGSDQR